tara:strand:- start:57 stop:551 length:495 start_codon:yes stop_codon:yes gene_type:complete
MLDKNGLLMVIDFGMAKIIDRKVTNKRGLEPNINLTLWHFHRQLGQYRIIGPKLKARNDEYMGHVEPLPRSCAPKLGQTLIFYGSLAATTIFADGWLHILTKWCLLIIFFAHLAEFIIMFGPCRSKLIGLPSNESSMKHFLPTMIFGFQHWFPFYMKEARRDSD